MKSIAEFVELTGRAIDPRVLPFAILAGLVLAAAALSFVALLRGKALVSAAEHRAKAGQARCEAALEFLQERLNGLAAELQEIGRQPPVTVVPHPPKPGLNLSKRSHALRMHRRGDPPDRIAAALDIPLQEVDLLLKVHRIVISSI
ncbi:MAG: hypothetical protein LAQ69_29255 [Acidobacteriia bacterium]|nr:hypothetical protein [Terriglobia bacterium]